MRTRDVYDLPHHPAAALFPMMGEAELRELAEDIKANGQMQQIILCEGKVIDGRNRLAACKLAGVRPIIADMSIDGNKVVGRAGEAVAPTVYVVSMNLHRRHLTTEQRREVIEALLKADPRRSNRQVAEQVKADDKTVGKVRKELEGRAEIPHVETRTDTRGRQQPATRKEAEADGRVESVGVGSLGSSILAEPFGERPMLSKHEETQRLKALTLADTAINALKQIAPSNPLRERAFEIVTDWIESAKRNRERHGA